ncbi:septal ring lytic transglycosylase RlpA family protein [uncultured Brevibacillus sp.]|uniref:septal ring lytic transglycosylase RlpA family protein n=1 Tax=uncultured Brevibacillus sp. TaxID=169970 RepID=UPI0025970C9B|nr:septal ring lytic transglycosylase RlpA family protein [uncultured Brevibacillus sp.]
MANNATYSGSIVSVNGTNVYTASDSTQASVIAQRLNYTFSDPNRDLDFITPSIVNGSYVVMCPLVRKNVGAKTYFYATSNAANQYYPAKLYENTHWSDPRNTNQTAILTISGSSKPWVDALQVANSIRYAVTPNFNTAAGKDYIGRFTVPTNISSSVASTIASSAILHYYGHPCQGTQPGLTSTCGSLTVENIRSASVANTEVFHPCDLTAAMTPTNNWNTTYRNKFVKVTNLSNGKSIVVRVTDTGPANQGIELTYRAWVEIGQPASNTKSVKIELLG